MPLSLRCGAAALALAGLLTLAQAAPGLPSTNVAWLAAAVDADIDTAFAQARAEKKPVLLYWGASWCPPC
ncbi:MAG: thioredoxin family protein, partial [Alphaproteobacteria bacterium]|nr:thioredoxin family protein [Alphaproteobacteria bacterium]